MLACRLTKVVATTTRFCAASHDEAWEGRTCDDPRSKEKRMPTGTLTNPALAQQLLDALDALSGLHPGFRPAHAKGLMCAGLFTPAHHLRPRPPDGWHRVIGRSAHGSALGHLPAQRPQAAGCLRRRAALVSPKGTPLRVWVRRSRTHRGASPWGWARAHMAWPYQGSQHVSSPRESAECPTGVKEVGSSALLILTAKF